MRPRFSPMLGRSMRTLPWRAMSRIAVGLPERPESVLSLLLIGESREASVDTCARGLLEPPLGLANISLSAFCMRCRYLQQPQAVQRGTTAYLRAANSPDKEVSSECIIPPMHRPHVPQHNFNITSCTGENNDLGTCSAYDPSRQRAEHTFHVLQV